MRGPHRVDHRPRQPQQATTTTTASTSDSNDVGACHDALGAVQAAQQQLHTSQKALAQASSHLDTLLSQQTPSSGSGSGSGAPSGGGPSSRNEHQGGLARRPALPRRLVQRSVLRRSHRGPEGGRRGQRPARRRRAGTAPGEHRQPDRRHRRLGQPRAGDTVSAGSSTANIVIAGPGGYEAVTMVKVTDLPNLKVGQAATVDRTAGQHDHRTGHRRRTRQHSGHHRHDLSSHHRPHR